MSRTVKLVSQVLAALVVVVAGAALLAGVIVPRLGGATPFTVTTGSMEPVLSPGSLVVVRPQESIATGDVITFLRSADGAVLTHRVVGVRVGVDGRIAYITRGDANNVADPGVVRPEQVYGVAWYHVPYLGKVGAVLGSHRQTVATGAALLLVAYAVWQVGQALRERSRHRPEAQSAPSTAAVWTSIPDTLGEPGRAGESVGGAVRSPVPDGPGLAPAGSDRGSERP